MEITADMLTEQQKECVKFPDDRNLLIRGVAGSGKSLVIVNRAIALAKKARELNKPTSIVIFTYVNTLVNYTNEIIEHCPEVASDITVNTLDSEIVRLYNSVVGGNSRNIYKQHPAELNRVADRLHDRYPKCRFFKEGMRTFLNDELLWMKEHMMKDVREYEDNPRKGRGSVRVSKADRPLIYEAYESFYDLLKSQHMPTFNTICEELYEQRDDIPDSKKYDYVFIDEAQDLPLNKMLIARELARKSMTIAADFAQKIYKSGFTWKEVGIEIRGQASKKLRGTHRNTKQIAMLANSLLQHNTELKKMSEDEYIQPELPTREGDKPVLVYEPSHEQEKSDVQSLLQTIVSQQPDLTIGVLGRDAQHISTIKSWIDSAGLSYQEIKKKCIYKVLTPGIKVVTYHSAKGLEFDIVILPFLDNGVFPYLHDQEKNSEDDETKSDMMNKERNLLYVGMTRARSQLYMFTCDGGDAEPSPLLDEMDSSMMDVKI